MRLLLLFMIFLKLAGAVTAQPTWEQGRDSLLRVLSHSREDSDGAMTMIYLGAEYEYNQSDSALYYFKRAYDLSARVHFVRGIVNGLSLQAGVLADRNDLDSAIALDSAALVISKKANYLPGLAAVYNNIALLYDSKGDLVRSVDYYLRALAMDEQFHDDSRLATGYSNISGVYTHLNEYEKAYAYSLKGIALGHKCQDKNAMESGYLNLSAALIKTNRPDSALIVLKDLVTLAMAYRDNDIVVGSQDNICAIYVDRGQWMLLKENATKLLDFARSAKEEQGIFLGQIRMFDYYWWTKDYSSAMGAIQEAIGRAKSEGLKKNLSNAYEKAAMLELVQGHVKAYSRYQVMKDSIDELVFSDGIVKNTQELEARYSLNKKQAEIDDLEKQQRIQQLTLHQQYLTIAILAVVAAVVGLVSILYRRNYLQKKKLLMADAMLQQQRIAELEKEQQLLATEAVLRGQVEERSRLAKDLHDGLGSILSGAKYFFTNMKDNLIISPETAAAFERGMGMLDTSIHELRRVAHNMMPEALMKFGLDSALRDFCQSIDQSGAIQLTYLSYNIDESTIPEARAAAIYRIVQELTNNVLKHAEAQTALVQVIRKENALSIAVEDDGKGFDISALPGSEGIGYLNLKNRVAWLSGTIDIQSETGKGTSVNIEIPNISA
jgi:two-component system, NarL family, sensor kinase